MNEYQIIDSRDLPKFLSEGWEYFCPCRPYGIDKLGIWVKRIDRNISIRTTGFIQEISP